MNNGAGIPGQGTTGATGQGGWAGAPAYLPPVTSAGPDWAAMAEANEREHRRRKLMQIGGGVLGVVLAGGIVATAVALQTPGKHQADKPVAASTTIAPDGTSSAGASASASPSPSASASASGSASPSPPAPGHQSSAPGGGQSSQAAPTPAGPNPVAGLQLAANAQVGPSDGHNGPTLLLHGTADGYAKSNVRIDTTRSFTVSAMIRNNSPAGGRAVITQGDAGYFAFDLGRDYWTNHNQWVFKVQTAAGNQNNTNLAAFGPTPTTGQWTLLTGVYDASAKTISLYVNGALSQTVSVPGIWQTSGNVELGRTMYLGNWTDPWDGAIADAQIWNQALPAGAVAKLNSTGGASAGVAPVASWLMP